MKRDMILTGYLAFLIHQNYQLQQSKLMQEYGVTTKITGTMKRSPKQCL